MEISVWTAALAFALGSPPDAVRFQLVQGYVILLEGRIRPLPNLHFVIDTGCNPSVIDRRTARRLGLVGRPTVFPVYGRPVPAERAVVTDLEVGPVRVQEIPVVIQDLSFTEAHLGVRVDALIGFDVLKAQSFTIDYKSRTIEFAPVEHVGSAAVFEHQSPFGVVTLDVDGHPVQVLLDTGARDLVLYRNRLRGRGEGLRPRGEKLLAHIGGASLVKTIEVGRARLGLLERRSIEGSLLESIDGSPPDGMLGPQVFRLRWLRFDFERNIISWDR